MMKRVLAMLLSAVMLLGLLSGCTDEPTIPEMPEDSTLAALGSAQPEDGEQEAEAGTEVVAQVSTTPGSFSMPYNASYGWDPYNCISMENQAVMELIYEGLFTLNNTFDAENALCMDYEVSENGLTYTLRLRNAKFSNGQALTAEDVVYSMARAQNSTVYASRFKDIAGYSADGDDTVNIHMMNANDRLPCLLTFPIVPNESAAYSPLGTGPFVREDNVLTQNSHWWKGVGNLQVERVALYASISAEDTRDNFEIDNVHFVYNDPIASTAATFHCDYELWNSRSTVMQYLVFNRTNGIFQDEYVRSAITYAIDRVGLAEDIYHNFADAASLPVAPASSMYNEDLANRYNYDPDEARRLLRLSPSFIMPGDTDALAEEGAVPDSELDEMENTAPEEAEASSVEEDQEQATITYNNITMIVRSGSLSRTTTARAIAEELEKFGFTVGVLLCDDQEFRYYINTGEYDLYFEEVMLRPDFDLRPLFEYAGSLNYSHITMDEEFSALFKNALENSGNRYDLYQYIMDNSYICPILFRNNAVFTTRGVFTGLNPTPDNLFYGIENVTVN